MELAQHRGPTVVLNLTGRPIGVSDRVNSTKEATATSAGKSPSTASMADAIRHNVSEHVVAAGDFVGLNTV
jgi:hypothetical protein